MNVIEKMNGHFEKNGVRYRICTEEGDTQRPAQYARENGFSVFDTLSSMKAAKKEELAAARYEQESSGLTLPSGMFVRTDERTRSVLTAGRLRADKDPAFVFPNWKLDDGTFIDMDAATITAIDNAVAAHIAAAFAKEKSLCDAVDSATTLQEVNSIHW